MKTEQKIEDKLEKIINSFAALAQSLGENPTEDQKVTATVQFAMISILGWVLDAEEELKPLFRNLKLAAAANAMEGIL